MKKIISISLCFIICLTFLVGCGKSKGPYEKGESLYELLDDAKINSIEDNLPKQIVLTIDKGGDQNEIKISNAEKIEELVDIFEDIEIGRNKKSSVSDNYNTIKFVWDDGETSTIKLCLYDLEVKFNGENFVYALKGMNKFFNKAVEISESKGKITPSETSQLELVKYSDNDINIDIPKGWKVSVWDGGTIDFYTFKVYNPDDDRYLMFFNMKNEGCSASQKDKDVWSRWYPSSPFAKLPVVNPHNCEGFYKVFNFLIENNTDNFYFPVINDFSIVETLGTNITGGDIVRATCRDDDHNNLDGIFTTTVKPVSLYYSTVTSIYGSTFYTVPEGMLVEWQPIFDKMLDSFTFTDDFTSRYYSALKQNAQSASELSKTLNETSDIITRGWEARQSTYDQISQKQSDATLGYERVYDVETGDIYKAKNGFMDSYSGSDLKPITDEMYNKPIAGYIDY